METSISKFFAEIEDPRIDRKKLYPLEEILLVSLCCIVCGGEGFEDMQLYGNEKLDFMRQFYPFKNGIPSADTFGRVYQILSPESFATCFIAWVKDLQNRTNKTIAIDGKLSRRSGSETQKALHLVSAYAHEEGLVLAQKAVSDKSNEITAIPDLLEILELKGTTVTIDSMGCQKEIAKKIIEKGGDYVLALKGNQEKLEASVKEVFEGKRKARFVESEYSEDKIIEKEHGRIEIRYCKAISVKNLPINVKEWKGIESIIEVTSIREIKEVKSEEKRYYISSLKVDAKNIGRCIRGHWSIENKLHWILDVTFNEDQSRIRTKNAAKNMALLRHTSMNMLRKDYATFFL